MTLKDALTHLRNVCINTNNTDLFETVKQKLENSVGINEHKQVEEIMDLVERIRSESTYSEEEVNSILQIYGADSIRINENSTSQVVCTCKFKRKTFQIKLLHPTARYVIGGGPWKVMTNLYTASAQKEAKKLQDQLSEKYPYKKVNINVDDYIMQKAETC